MDRKCINIVNISGIVSEFVKFSHISESGENMVRGYIMAKRLSGRVDKVPFICSEEIGIEKYVGKNVEIRGRYASHDWRDKKGKRHLMINVMVTNIRYSNMVMDKNSFSFEGFVVSTPKRFDTLKGIACELKIAINGERYSEYVPAISWNKVAESALRLKVGDKVYVKSRLQSREFGSNRIAYEAAISTLIKREDNDEKSNFKIHAS